MDTLYLAHCLAGIAQIVGEELLSFEPRQTAARRKPCGDWVTSADEYSHELLVDLLADCFPGTPLVLEEQANAPTVPDTCIVADELDGTHVYRNGLQEWGITLAYLERGRPVAGVLFQPVAGVLIRTARGNGTWLDGERLRLDAGAALEGRLASGEINRHLEREELLWLGTVAGHCAGVRTQATTIGNVVELLRGGTVLFLNPRGGKVWDFAAAVLAVEEAGGVALSPAGEALAWSGIEMGVVLAANAWVAETAVSLWHARARPTKVD